MLGMVVPLFDLIRQSGGPECTLKPLNHHAHSTLPLATWNVQVACVGHANSDSPVFSSLEREDCNCHMEIVNSFINSRIK